MKIKFKILNPKKIRGGFYARYFKNRESEEILWNKK